MSFTSKYFVKFADTINLLESVMIIIINLSIYCVFRHLYIYTIKNLQIVPLDIYIQWCYLDQDTGETYLDI